MAGVEFVPTPEREPSDPDLYDRFTEDSLRLLVLAQEEAYRLRHNYIGTEHLILGVIALNTPVLGEFFEQTGLTLGKVRLATMSVIGCGDRPHPNIRLTPLAKNCIGLAQRKADSKRSDWVTPEHVLYGLVEKEEGTGVGVLASLGVRFQDFKRRLEIVMTS